MHGSAKIKPLERFIIDHGYIDKSNPQDKDKFEELFKQSTFFIMLSQAETFGIVYCEASAYGVPSLAHNIGGVSSAVTDGVNGKLFYFEEDVSSISQSIIEMTENVEAYTHLAKSSWNLYRKKLNWKNSADLFKSYVEELF